MHDRCYIADLGLQADAPARPGSWQASPGHLCAAAGYLSLLYTLGPLVCQHLHASIVNNCFALLLFELDMFRLTARARISCQGMHQGHAAGAINLLIIFVDATSQQALIQLSMECMDQALAACVITCLATSGAISHEPQALRCSGTHMTTVKCSLMPRLSSSAFTAQQHAASCRTCRLVESWLIAHRKVLCHEAR